MNFHRRTLLKAALGIIPTVSGEVRVFGEPLAGRRNRIAYVPQRQRRLGFPGLRVRRRRDGPVPGTRLVATPPPGAPDARARLPGAGRNA